MHQPTTDVIVRVARPLAEGECQTLAQALGAAAGIRSVRCSQRARQLLLIDYDPRTISALGVLRCLRTFGLEGRLIGM
jgi:hypothetical protein